MSGRMVALRLVIVAKNLPLPVAWAFRKLFCQSSTSSHWQLLALRTFLLVLLLAAWLVVDDLPTFLLTCLVLHVHTQVS